MIRYIDIASSREEAESRAVSLLFQLSETGEPRTFFTKEGKAEDGSLLYLSLSFQDSLRDPAVYINQRKPETSEEEGSYSVYFLYDRERLSFIDKHLADVPLLLPTVRPLLKWDESLTVEAVTSPAGRDLLEAYFDYGAPVSHQADVQLFKETPKPLRLFTLFDSFGELSPQEVKEALEAGDYDGGEKDGERILAEVLGRPLKDEADYLATLSEYCGAGVVKRYASRLRDGFRFYRLDYSLKYLEYSFRQVEDYPTVKEKADELERALGSQDKTLAKYVREEGYSLLEVVLARYLGDYTSLPSIFDGLSPQRLADYLNVPSETFRKVEASDSLKNTLL